LGRLLTAWMVFRNYAERYREYEFYFNPVDPPLLNPIKQPTLLEKARSYPRNMSKRATALQQLGSDENPNFTVHCEMQLLLSSDALPKQEACFLYFGCSERSCWICHEILESYSKYYLRGTHGRRVGLRTLDSIGPARASPKIAFALKKLQDNMTDELLKEAFRMDLLDKSRSMKDVLGLQDGRDTNPRAEKCEAAVIQGGEDSW
jgi:OTT_1508-like deaminase